MTGIQGLKELFGAKFIRPIIGDRVMHNETRLVGTVQGTSTVHGSMKVPVITVQFDNSTWAWYAAENEFTKVGRSACL